MANGTVTYEKRDALAEIELNRPDSLNALDVPSWDALRDHLRTADADRDVRVVVLSGRGKAFCAGDDIADFEFETVGDAREYARHIMECGLTIERIETPVIAKVDGLAHGGGCELAAIPDVTIASTESSFRLPESKVGAVPGIGLVRFPDLIGLKRTRELMLTNRELSATEAEDIGLVNEVVDPSELAERVEKRAAQIAATAPMSSRLIKRICNSRLSDEAHAVNALTLILSMEDAKEGMDAFFSDREPDWQDN
jgi:enoyl-CoA hydratase/carnithine racemase